MDGSIFFSERAPPARNLYNRTAPNNSLGCFVFTPRRYVPLVLISARTVYATLTRFRNERLRRRRVIINGPFCIPFSSTR